MPQLHPATVARLPARVGKKVAAALANTSQLLRWRYTHLLSRFQDETEKVLGRTLTLPVLPATLDEPARVEGFVEERGSS